MHDLLLFISICNLLKSIHVLKNTKASKDFGAANPSE